MQIGICTSPTTLAGLDDPPFDYVEGHVQQLFKPEAPEAEFEPSRALVASARRPLPACNCFLPGDLKVTGPSVDHDRLARYTESACARGASLGLKIIVFGSGGARHVPEGWSAARGFEQYVEALRIVGPIAARHGVTIVVEPLNRGECNLINTIDEGAEAVQRADTPGARLLVDFFHMLRNGESPDPIVRHAELIYHAHLAEKDERTAAGVKGDDFRPFLRALRSAPHCPRISFECKWGDVAAEGPAAVAALRRQLADVA
jgi:sugar phosphate isomerase/epimerase